MITGMMHAAAGDPHTGRLLRHPADRLHDRLHRHRTERRRAVFDAASPTRRRDQIRIDRPTAAASSQRTAYRAPPSTIAASTCPFSAILPSLSCDRPAISWIHSSSSPQPGPGVAGDDLAVFAQIGDVRHAAEIDDQRRPRLIRKQRAMKHRHQRRSLPAQRHVAPAEVEHHLHSGPLGQQPRIADLQRQMLVRNVPNRVPVEADQLRALRLPWAAS